MARRGRDKNMRRSAVTFGLGLAMRQLPATAAHVFPYVPTQILMPAACWNESICGGADVAYIFSQSDGGGVEFSALNYSNTVGADTQLTTITSELPFLKDAPATTAFGAARTSNGSIVVYSGACDDTTGSLWSYSNLPGQGGSSTWSKKMTTPGTADQGSSRGPYFLGGTLAFSSRLAPTMDQPTIYTYGGMCNSPGADSTSWQSSANYTPTMMSLAPNSQDADTAYSLSVASTAGPRTPIAGFTLTQLPASMTKIAGSTTQQADFVLLGGHTQQAFINMSTAAVWHLPEQSWSYINIGGPDSSSAELAVRDALVGRAATEVESRSGHTAVLTEDGSSVVVFGGWVGDVTNSAEPQLVVLKLSQRYSSWKWAVPRAQPDGKGVYGHGAAMLPGNVMMVYGGWETSATSGGMTSKRQTSAGRGAPRFFNVTSMSWSNSYTNPNSGKLVHGKGNHDAPERHGSEQSRRLGLGLGLGLGLALLLGVILATYLWRLRLEKRRRSRELAARSMAQDAQYFAHDTDEMMERDNASYPWFVPPRNDEDSAGLAAAGESSRGYESLRGAGVSLDDGHGRPVVTRKPVMSRAMRGGYVPTETHLNAFVSPPGRIHPIMEDDEEDHAYHEHPHHHHHPLDAEPLTPTSEAPSDPFLTPTATAPPILFPPMNTSSSATPSSESHRYYDPDVQDWVSDVDAADSLLDKYNSSRKGRISPTRRNSTRSTALRDDESRSGSNLSDSNRSTADSLRRSQSNRRSAASGGFFGGTLLGGVDHAKPGSSSSSSYNTARSGFGTLQAEGPALLSGTSPSHNPGCGGDEEDDVNAPPSPSKTKPRRGWLGSLGRVFSQSSGSPPVASPERSPARDGPEMDFSTGDYEPRAGLRGELLRRKQGRQDWEADARAQGGGGGSGPSTQDNEWDIERAVEQRLVQVMFTVPKERLRVVNGGEEVDDEQEHEQEHERERETLTKRAQLQETSGGLPDPQMAELVDPEKSSDKSVVSAERERGRSSRVEDPDLLHVDVPEERRRSHSTDDSGRRFSGAVLTAEAVRFEKPRGRVLQMVESIESSNGSQENSPTRTPERKR